MADLDTTDVQSRTLTAFFDSRDMAQKAHDDLVALGIPRQHVRLTEGSGTPETATDTTTGGKGFWEELKDLFLPNEDRYGYAEGLARGGHLVSVQVEEGLYNQAVDVLDRDGAVDMDEREASWRSSGWSGYDTGTSVGLGSTGMAAAGLDTPASRSSTDYRSDAATGMSAAGLDATATRSATDYRATSAMGLTGTEAAGLSSNASTDYDASAGTVNDATAARSASSALGSPTTGASSTATGTADSGIAKGGSTGTGGSTAMSGSTAVGGGSAAAGAAARSGDDEVIPVYEETARIGKRDVNQGRVRLRSYVVETPVQEQVNLRNEQVQVDRRPVDRPVSSADAVFQDRTIEAEEHAEQAVIDKETRVKEEIALRKTVENQTQTVSDTVRRTEVEIDDQRHGQGLGATSGVAAREAATGGASAFVDTSRIADHMEVKASDGTTIGTVDHLDGDRIKLAKSTSPDGEHHYLPLSWVDHVDTHVHLNKSSADAKAGW